MSTLTPTQPRQASPARWARLRLVSDEGLLKMVRQGDEAAFNVLVRRYDAQIFAFCRHMLGSREDAEDVMQETWSAAYRAMVRDDRALTIRAWLYAIARNRCLNAMRTSGPRPTLVPVDTTSEASAGVLYTLPSADDAAKNLADRERFRVLIGDIQELPENQRTALVLYELDALSYEEIAGVLDVSVGAVKSLLVRARLGLTESAEARELDCDVVRLELAAAAQRVAKLRAPSKAHVRNCEDCSQFERQLKKTTRSLTAALSPAPVILLWLHKLGLGKLTLGKIGGGTIAAGSAAGGSTVVTAGGGAFALKAAATVAAAALATAGAGEVRHLSTAPSHKPRASHKAPAATQQVVATARPAAPAAAKHSSRSKAKHTARRGRRTELAGVTIAPTTSAAVASTKLKSTTHATHAAGGLRVSTQKPKAPSGGRPAVSQPDAVPSARPVVSGQPDPAAAPTDSTAAAPVAPTP